MSANSNYPMGVDGSHPHFNAPDLYCPICEADLESVWEFCPYCGANVEQSWREYAELGGDAR